MTFEPARAAWSIIDRRTDQQYIADTYGKRGEFLWAFYTPFADCEPRVLFGDLEEAREYADIRGNDFWALPAIGTRRV
jgi:hypothetical protein